LSAGLKILAYLIATVALGATLAPWLFWTGQSLSHYRFLGFLGSTDFQRYFNRAVLIAAFLLLIPLFRLIGSRRFRDLGLQKNPRRNLHLVGGFLISSLSITALGACFLKFDVFELKAPVPWNMLPLILVSSITVALIEEALFRGAILGLVRQTLSNVPAVLFVSALFSAVHLLSPPKEQIRVVHWYSGFELLPHALWRFTDPWAVLGSGVTLAILGMLLAHATLKTSSLWLAIGIHSGLIFSKMGFNKVTNRTQDLAPWFGGDITSGIGSILIILFLWLVIWLVYLHGESDSERM
jgi:membrane protease YdiL (CAAX protease family)